MSSDHSAARLLHVDRYLQQQISQFLKTRVQLLNATINLITDSNRLTDGKRAAFQLLYLEINTYAR